MEIYVIRHTKVAVDSGFCYGQADVPLADSFPQEVRQLADKLPSGFDAVYCSPLQRCVALADALNLMDVQQECSLMEMHFGDWENRAWNDLDQTRLQQWMDDFVHERTPNGESLVDVYQRVAQFIDELRNQPHQQVLLVTHAGVIRCIWTYLLNIPLANIFKIPVAFGELFIFRLSDDASTDGIIQKQ